MDIRGWITGHTNRLLQLRATPEAIAIGVASGVFFGFTPLFGLKTLLAIGCAWVLRGNKIAAAIAVTLHDVFLPLWPFMLRLEYDIGYWALSHPHELPPHLHMHGVEASTWLHWSTFLTAGLPMLIGAFVMGAPMSVLAYFVARWFLIRREKNKMIEDR